MRDLFKKVMTGSMVAGAALLVVACGGSEDATANNTATTYNDTGLMGGNDTGTVDTVTGANGSLDVNTTGTTGADVNTTTTTDTNTTTTTTDTNTTGAANTTGM